LPVLRNPIFSQVFLGRKGGNPGRSFAMASHPHHSRCPACPSGAKGGQLWARVQVGREEEAPTIYLDEGGACSSGCRWAARGSEVGSGCSSGSAGEALSAACSPSSGAGAASERWGGFSRRCCASCKLAMVLMATRRIKLSTEDCSGVEASPSARSQLSISLRSFHIILLMKTGQA